MHDTENGTAEERAGEEESETKPTLINRFKTRTRKRGRNKEMRRANILEEKKRK